jgi:hypothetical protein
MEQWCSDCKGSTFYSEPSSSTSKAPQIDLPLPLGRSGLNLSSQGIVAIIVARYGAPARCDRTTSGWSWGDKTDGEGHDRDGDGHVKAVHDHNTSQVYVISYN